ncbi:partial Sensor histidine kinase RcsC, partial [Gallionellaceae bacterium]
AIRGAYVLLVEDNPFNQQVATELLEDAGVIVCVANNGEEALDLLQQEEFDCVLMDVQMPVMDGFEATRRIRLEPALGGLRVIAMTANAEPEDRVRCLAAGMDDFLTKPILPDLLYATLAKWVAGRVCALAQQRTGERRTRAGRRARDRAPAATALRAVPIAATPKANDPAIIDLTVLARMVGNDPAKIRKFALKFLTSAQEGLDEIQAALARKDMAAVAALGHRIKSPAKTVGALGFAELCQTLEQCKHAADAEQAQSILSQLYSLLAQIRMQTETSFPGQSSPR